MSMATLTSPYSMRPILIGAGQRPNPVDANIDTPLCMQVGDYLLSSVASDNADQVDDGALLDGTRCQKDCRGVL
jgi:hypothetical protein